MARRAGIRRPGSVLPLVAISLVVIVTFVAMAIDIGLMTLARNHVQMTADAGAMAGVRQLHGKPGGDFGYAAALAEADAQAKANRVLGSAPDQVTVTIGSYYYGPPDDPADPDYGTSDKTKWRFNHRLDEPTDGRWSAVQVEVTANRTTFFAPVGWGGYGGPGYDAYTVKAKATSVHRPRDVALILDFSGSMRFESCNSRSGSSYASGGNPVDGSMNPDPAIPNFGHWASYQSNPGRLRRTSGLGSAPYYYPPGNWTMDSPDAGPAIVKDYQYDASGDIQFLAGTDVGATMADAAVNPANLKNAFHNPTATWDAAFIAANMINTPAPSNDEFRNQTDPNYLGDKWPRRCGASGTFPDVSDVALGGPTYARSVRDYLDGNHSNAPNNHIKNWSGNGLNAAQVMTGYPGGDFESVGYDINGNVFKGYSFGPGYYGKTLFMWPPDPRYDPANGKPWDWRKRFFYYPGNPNQRMDDNARLFETASTTRYLRAMSSTTHTIDYAAILQWIKQPPRPLPPNLRAGRVLYYKHIPDYIYDPGTIGTNGTGTISGSPDVVADKLFWKNYIDYVLGHWNNSHYCLYGMPNEAFAGGATVRITSKTSLTGPDGMLGTGDEPYMEYSDCPRSPIGHFWFGPLSMMDFISIYNRSWVAGTVHESQSWQLKAGVNSALNDIEKNHPNDWVTLIYYSGLDTYNTARVALGKDYPRMKNALFYPFNLLDNMPSGSSPDETMEWRPYNPSTFADRARGVIPHADGSTCPEMGIWVAYNQFSTATGYNGRRGAAKIVVLETDGVPNMSCNNSFNDGGSGQQASYMTGLSAYNDSDANDASNAVKAVAQLCSLDTSAQRGYSTGAVKARVHAIAFGDLFNDLTTTEAQNALTFLYNVQVAGNTSNTPFAGTQIEPYKVITGSYDQRINRLRSALERIMQSGVQVSLTKGQGE